MPSLKTNLVKRVERLPKPTRTSEALQPLFEAVSNSIHSTQQRFGDDVANQGRIEIEIETNRKLEGVKVIIHDNGVGLNDENFSAFSTTDTDHKIKIGGKGVGRLLWLDCFASVHVVSQFEGNLNKFWERQFDFRLTNSDQIQNFVEKELTSPPLMTGTTIQFEGLRDNAYGTKFPGRASYVFQHFTSHFLPTFIGRRSPSISVHCGGDTREYPQAIDELIHRREDVEKFETSKYGILSLTLMECDKVASADLVGSHFVHFIAHDRTVKSQKIDAKLGLKYFGESFDRVFHACIFGEFLDNNVNQERTSFMFEDSIIEDIINEVCMPHIQSFLDAPLRRQREVQSEIVSKIVDTYPSVAFGEVEELQEYVPLGELNDDAIYGHLSRQRYRRDKKQAEKIRAVLTRLRGAIDENTLSSAIAEASRAIEEAEQKSLAEYIVRRKVVLDFLEILIEKVRNDTKDSSYQREDILHTFICPMRVNAMSSSDRNIVPSSHDLWIIDERLTFAQYFSSDVSFNELAKEFESEERPDILIFDKVHGLRQTDDSSKILLVEFKRPGRTEYGDDENPHLQVERYIKRLLGGQVLDVRGRPVRIKPDTVFYCFIVADCIGPMEDWTYSWSPTADGRGRIYQPRNGFHGSIELIEWDALLSDARQRNYAFFDRAGMSGESFFSDDYLTQKTVESSEDMDVPVS